MGDLRSENKRLTNLVIAKDLPSFVTLQHTGGSVQEESDSEGPDERFTSDAMEYDQFVQFLKSQGYDDETVQMIANQE